MSSPSTSSWVEFTCEISDVYKIFDPSKQPERSRLQKTALREDIAGDLKDCAQKIRDALGVFNVRYRPRKPNSTDAITS